MNIDAFLEFSRLLTSFQKVERVPYTPGTNDRENDAEHSYRLALTAWYIVSSKNLDLNLDLNLELVLKLALAHDLVEVHAGDTYIYSKDSAHLESKIAREEAAATTLAETFPEFIDMHQSLRDYVARDTPEARFVYALDKILPLLTNLEDSGRGWREDSITLQMLIDKKKDKVALSPEIEPYYNELISILRDREKEIFE